MGKKSKNVADKIAALDCGTPELQARGIYFTGTNESERVAHTKSTVPLDYYVGRSLISDEQFKAGSEFFRLWFYGAEKGNCPQMRFGIESGGTIDFDSAVALEQLYQRAEKSIKGTIQRLVVYRVCCWGEWAGYLNYVGEKRRMQMLKDGLDDLVRHFKGKR